MIDEPGRVYDYCNHNFHLLSAIVEATTGMTEVDFAQRNLFGPLDTGEVLWPVDPREAALGESHYAMAPYDMAKLGQLFLDGGFWGDQQVVSCGWVQAATSPEDGSYGYMWWLDRAGYYATGVGGQEIWVVPDLDMVVVMTGASGGGGTGAWGSGLMHSHILPLAESEAPLTSNPVGTAALEATMRLAPAPVPVAPTLPETAQQVTGRTFVMDTNPAGLEFVSLGFTGETEAGWWESEDVFIVQQEDVGGVTREHLTATFESDRITLEIREFFMGLVEEATFAGRLEQ